MARTPSKITKRDIDKDLYLEIVNEASNETNIQKLLDDYVRKDEGIAEWQLPTKYRQDLTKRINDLDSDVQNLKSDPEQKNWKSDIEKRMQVVEKKTGISSEDDPAVSPIIGTQVAANTTNISKNSKQITILSGNLERLESTHTSDKLNLENADTKLQQDFDTKLEATSTRMGKIETLMASKRNKTDLITYNDLDDHIKKNMQAVLNIGESTLSTLDNMDAFVKRVDDLDTRLQKSEVDVQNAVSDVKTTKSMLEQNVSSQIETIRDTEKKDVENLKTSMDKGYKDLQDVDASTRETISALQTKSARNSTKIDQVNDKVENVAQSAQNNAINVASCQDKVDELKDSFSFYSENTKSEISNIKKSIVASTKHPEIAPGKLLAVNDKDGVVTGKDLVLLTYISGTTDDLYNMLKNSMSPIYNLSGNTMMVLNSEAYSGEDAGKAEAAAEAKDSSEEDKGRAIVEMTAQKYDLIPDFSTLPENCNRFIFDLKTESIQYYIDGSGNVRGFGTIIGGTEPNDVSIPAKGNLEFYRHNANKRIGVTVYLKDNEESSTTKGKWINSEGVITVAYEDMSYIVYNSSSKEQIVRIIEG